MLDLPSSPLQKIKLDLPYELYIKRDDLLHPLISGNKWRKLKYNIEAIKDHQKTIFVTKGGNYSNHIYATAAAGKVFNFRTIGLIRGERVDNATLRFAAAQGMELIFCNRNDYRNINEDNFGDFISSHIQDTNTQDVHFLPEGGTNTLALLGSAEIVTEITAQLPDLDWSKTVLATAVGTGGTLAGMINGAAGRGHLLGIATLKGDFLAREVSQLCDTAHKNWSISNDFHFGGYARWTPELIDFIRGMEQAYDLPLDPIYTSKLFFALFDMMQNRTISEDSIIIAIHTGGLQGRIGFEEQHGISFSGL